MLERNGHLSAGRLVLGLAFASVGVLPILAAFDVGPLDVRDINGPPWLAAVAGGIFVAGGLSVAGGDSFPALRALFAMLIMVGLAALGNWIAFGLGERTCTGSLSLQWFPQRSDLSGLGCRIPFGLGAAILDAALFYAMASLLQKSRGGPPRLTRLMNFAQALLLISLAPILLPLLAVLIVRTGFVVVATRLKTGAWPRNEAFIRRRRKKSP